MPFEPPLRRGKARTRARRVAFAAIAVAAAGLGAGAYYLLAVYGPGQRRGAAQAEIARWEIRLAAARGCLLGDGPPPAPSTREVIAIRELSPDPWNRGTCTQLISQLSRGETEDTGLPAVEDAWRGIERAAAGVGAAFLARVDPAGEKLLRRGKRAGAGGSAAAAPPDPGAALPDALDALDAAAAALRAAARMSPPVAPAAPPPLPVAQLLPLRDGDQPVRELTSWTTPSMGAAVAFGSSEDHELQLTLVPGAPPLVRPVGAGVLRAVPDAAWGAAGGPDRIVVGPLDEAGELAAPGAAPAAPGGGGAADPRVVKIEGSGRIFAVAGTAEDGLVVGGGVRSLVLVRSRAGKLTADKPQAIAQLAFALDPAGRTLVAYNDDPDAAGDRGRGGDDAGGRGRGGDDADGRGRGGDDADADPRRLHAFVAGGAAPARVADLGATTASAACLTARRGWIVGVDSVELEARVPVVAFDLESGAAAPQALPDHNLIGCTADAALLRERNTARFAVCTDACRAVTISGARPARLAALAGDEVVAILHRDRLLAVLREKGPPRYFTVSAPLSSLQLAQSDGKVIDVIAQSDAGVVVLRVPAR